MSLQYIGSADFEGERLSMMACIDADRPNEWMLHWWRSGSNDRIGAALVELESSANGTLTFAPRLLYRAAEQGGGLYLPVLTQEERQFFAGWTLQLIPDNDALKGTVAIGTERSRPPLPSSMIPEAQCGRCGLRSSAET